MLIAPLCLSAQQTSGVFVNEATAYPGYVLFSNNEQTYLIDNCGLVVNQWSSDYKPGESVYLLENGNLLRTAKIDSDFGLGGAGGRGGRLELFTWDNELIWHFEMAGSHLHLHHDIEPLPNGNILVVGWEKRSAGEAQQAGRITAGEVWSERIMELEIKANNEAAIVWEWKLWDHLIQSANPALNNYDNIAQNPQLVDINYNHAVNTKNWVHINSIDYNEEFDQIILSSRLFSEVWIIDHGTTSQEAAGHNGGLSGKGGDLLYRFGNPPAHGSASATSPLFQHQHDARWITNSNKHRGKLMVFNNLHTPTTSSIEIWEAPTDNNGHYLKNDNTFLPLHTEWSFSPENFFSQYMGSAHLLPNEHLFICEANKGRFLEIDTNHQIVWEYINPVNKNGGPAIQGGTVRFNDTFRATKYPQDYPAFLDKDLTPGLPIELSPIENDCFTPTPTTNTEIHIELLGNLLHDHLVFSTSGSQNTYLSIYNTQAQIIWHGLTPERDHQINISNWPAGVYTLVFTDKKDFHQTHRIIKY